MEAVRKAWLDSWDLESDPSEEILPDIFAREFLADITAEILPVEGKQTYFIKEAVDLYKYIGELNQNGVPHGRGRMYQAKRPYAPETILTGFWLDGNPHGLVEVSIKSPDGGGEKTYIHHYFHGELILSRECEPSHAAKNA